MYRIEDNLCSPLFQLTGNVSGYTVSMSKKVFFGVKRLSRDRVGLAWYKSLINNKLQ